MLRKGTRAAIKTSGLLGDKYIELAGGRADEPEVPIGGEIPAAPGAGIEKFLEGSGDLLTDLGAIAKSLKTILGRTEKGEGFLGALTSSSPESARARQQLQRRAALAQRDPQEDRQRPGPGRQAPHRREVRPGDERVARRGHPVGPVAAGEDRRGRPDRDRRHPGAALGPGGQEEGLRARRRPRDRGRGARRRRREPGARRRGAPDPPERPAVRQGVHRRTCRASPCTSTRSAASSMRATARPASSSTTPRSSTRRTASSSASTSRRSCAGSSRTARRPASRRTTTTAVKAGTIEPMPTPSPVRCA